MQTDVYYIEYLQAACRNYCSSVMKLRKSAGGLLSDFYDHWAYFNIRYALSVLKYTFKKRSDLSFQYVRSRSLWLPTSQLLTDEYIKICVVLHSRIVFTIPGCSFGVFLLCDKTFQSFADYLQAWWESFDHRLTDTALAWLQTPAEAKFSLETLNWRNPTVI